MKRDVTIELDQVTKRFDNVTVLNNISLRIGRGSFTTLLGPSGCGKTTLLRLIAGFYEADAGRILINGKRMNDVPPHKRNTPFVFQDYALFPHMTVYQNIAYGSKLQHGDHQRTQGQVTRLLKLLGLTGLEERFPRQLSGGQQQRVALARALAVDSDIVLMDEPLSNLDTKLRVDVREEIRRLQQQLEITAVYVTHDQEEALAVSDVIIVMRQGKIEQIGSPQEIYFQPQNQFVAGFVGTANFIPAAVCGVTDDEVELRTADAVLRVTNQGYDVLPGQTAYLMLRPEAIRLAAARINGANAIAAGEIRTVSFLGAKTRYWIKYRDREYIVDDFDRHYRLSAGDAAVMSVDGSKTWLLSAAQMEAGFLA